MRCVAKIQRFVKVIHLIYNVTTTIYRLAQIYITCHLPRDCRNGPICPTEYLVALRRRNISVSTVTDQSLFNSRQMHLICLYSKASRRRLRSTQPPSFSKRNGGSYLKPKVTWTRNLSLVSILCRSYKYTMLFTDRPHRCAKYSMKKFNSAGHKSLILYWKHAELDTWLFRLVLWCSAILPLSHTLSRRGDQLSTGTNLLLSDRSWFRCRRSLRPSKKTRCWWKCVGTKSWPEDRRRRFISCSDVCIWRITDNRNGQTKFTTET